MRIYKLDPSGPKRFAVRNSGGQFTLGDPRFGNAKHKTENQIYVASENEAISLIRKGFSIRVDGGKAPSLVRSNLHIDGVKVS